MKKNRNRPWLWTTLILLTVAASALLTRSLGFLQESPFSFSHPWHMPSAVAVAPDGSMAVVENSKMTVTITDPQGRVRARIRGGSYDTDSFYYAEHIATDGQSVVLAEVQHAPSSTFVQSERLIQYDMDGNRLGELYAVAYAQGEQPRQIGHIRSVALTGGQVTFAWALGGAAGASVCEGGETHELIRVAVHEGDDVLRAAYGSATQTLAVSTKKGMLGVSRAGKALAWLAFADGERIPWSVGVTAQGAVLVSELAGESVWALRGQESELLWQGGLVYELTAAGEGAGFTDGESVLIAGGGGAEAAGGNSVALAPLYALRVALTWASAVYLACMALWLAGRLWLLLRRQAFSEARRRMLLACACVLVTVVVVMAFLMSFTQSQLQAQTLNSIAQLAETVSATSGTVFGDSLSRIDALADYRGEDYNAVRRYMDAFCDASYRNGANLYYILYRFDNTMLYGVMDYENTTGVRYPYCPLEGTVYGDVARTGRSVRVEGEANIYGMWSYAVAPVYRADGAVAGLVEIGTNQYGEVLAREELIRRLLTGVLVALLMGMLIFNEFTAFGDHLARRKVLRMEGGQRIALGFIRPLIFLVFLADNTDAAFIPQLSASLGAAVGWLPVALASALPMSLQLFAIGASALVSGRVLDRSHPRTVLLGGFALQTTGALLAMAAVATGQYWFLLLAKALGGIGTGAAVVTCNALPARTDERGEQQALISGLNVGVITGVVLGSSAGAHVADFLGYPAAYLCSVLFVLQAVALTLHSLRGTDTLSATPEEGVGGRGDTLRFLRDPRVLGFLLMVMLPYMLMMYFKDYLFPLFASGLGKTESVIGSVMLLGGAIAIFLGDVVPGTLIGRLGAWNGVRLSNLICVYALALFALKPSFETAVITICLLGVSASFGYASQGMYYTDLIRSNRIGDGKAMGLYSLFDNLGQTSGPLALGALLFMGVAAESAAIALGAAGLLGVATLLRQLGDRRRRGGA